MNETLVAIVVSVFASSGFWALLTAVYTNRAARKKEADDDIDVIKKALLSVLYDKIYERSMRLLRVGQTTVEDRENVHQMLKPYEQLGGDGLIHDLVDRVDELPLYVDGE